MAKRKPGTIRSTGSSSRVKGRLVESVVAAMHDVPGVTVQRNVRMPVLGSTRRTSEIDVLISGNVAGYPLRIPIECKNERVVTGTPKINLFIGKLQDVGLPVQHAIYISVKGFTKGAIERARTAGIRTLVLTGLTDERLAQVVHEAIRASTYLYAAVTRWTIRNDITDLEEPGQLGIFFDETGNVCGSVADLIWRAWIEGQIPDTLGEHEIELPLPLGWRHLIAGKESIPERISAHVRVEALAIFLKGKARAHHLFDAATHEIERAHLDAQFNPAEAPLLKTFTDESGLSDYLKTIGAPIQINSRARFPRVEWYGTLWPPSVQLIQKIDGLAKAGVPPAQVNLRALDPPRLYGMWDPVWFSPMLQGILAAKFE